MNSPAPVKLPERSLTEPFQAVIITLSAALLVLFGIVIGRFVVTTQAIEFADSFDDDLKTLQAEVVLLRHQLADAQTRAQVAQQSADRFRQRAALQQMRVEKLTDRRNDVDQALDRVRRDRQAYLDEMQQHVALERSIPARDVLRFAEDWYAEWTQTLQQFVEETDSVPKQVSSLPSLSVSESLDDPLPTLEQDSVADQATLRTTSQTFPQPSLPRLPAPGGPIKSSASPARAKQGVFFTPSETDTIPKSQAHVPAERQTGRLISRPAASGITFLDTAGTDKATIKR